MEVISKSVTSKFRFADLTDEEREELSHEKTMEEIHLEKVRAFHAQWEREKKKYDPRYQWIAYGYRDIHFSDSKFDKITRNGIKFVENFNNFFQPKHVGLLISGTCGTGKSFLTAMIANEMADRGYIVYMARINDAIEQFNDFNDKTLQNMITNRAFSLIILDDFGASRETEYQIDRLLNLIDAIKISQIPLIVTTNLSIGELVNEPNIKLKRIYDRIIEMCSYFPPMTGESKRIKEAKALSDITRGMFDSED